MAKKPLTSIRSMQIENGRCQLEMASFKGIFAQKCFLLFLLIKDNTENVNNLIWPIFFLCLWSLNWFSSSE